MVKSARWGDGRVSCLGCEATGSVAGGARGLSRVVVVREASKEMEEVIG